MIPQRPIHEDLDRPPTVQETLKAVKQLSSGKAAGSDGLPAEIFKHGGDQVAMELTQLFIAIWDVEAVPQDFKDVVLVHLFKNKGNKYVYDNHRSISLLVIAGKIFGKIIINRLVTNVVNEVYPESQCGFRVCYGTVDMLFSARQVQEKCIE